MTPTLVEPQQTARSGEDLIAVVPDVLCQQIRIVNAYFVGPPAGPWTLVDTGVWPSAGRLMRAAAARFGPGSRPQAIVLTHGHFDHVGGVEELAAHWDVPVYAHPLEMPYLTGRSPYPPPDPTVGGGLMTYLSPLYPRGPINLGERVRPLPGDGTVPGMPGWRWLPTPGHSPGHVSLFRDADRVLLAGDAFVTTREESALAVLTQPRVVHRPPAYYTCDWEAAGRSVVELARLRPEAAATGHGLPMYGEALRRGLEELAINFERVAVPSHGRYVRHPAVTDRRGIVALPPSDLLPKVLVGLTVAACVGAALTWASRRES